MTARALVIALIAAVPAAAQQTTAAADFRWEKALGSGSAVRLHNIAGDVTVSPSTNDRVEVVGIKRGPSRYFADVTLEVVEVTDGIIVCAMYRDADMRCDEDGYRVERNRRRGRDDDDYDRVSIDIVVKVPRGLSVSANSVSGNVTVTDANGASVRGGSVSGNVRMTGLRAASIRGSSVSGDVDVAITALTGDGDLRFTSVSGDVIVDLPPSLDADVSMRSVSGELNSDFPLTLNGRVSRSSLSARIGKGGRELRVTTVSGDVSLRSIKQ
ncbi:MAG TPA: DUF4097 family beta strand repeat-containing protein [Gemmatimonadaceae bacterium]|nr:DUF4097 family beta strand repeat-containing protein [Gemmatimonadaceae bacterium]